MTDLYFEDAEIGATSKAGPYLVSKEEIIRFATQYDPVPRHLDEEAAARSIFGGLTASSAHTFAVFISLTPNLQPRLHVLAGMGWDELRLPNPVRPGDELDLELIVLEKRESKSKPDRGIVRNQVRLRNQRREIVLQCIGNVLIARRPDAKAKT
jgi:acyl dehydratase